MRKSFWMIPLVLLFTAIGTPSARADAFDNFAISFSGANAPTAAPGTVLAYDATTNEFTTPSFVLTFEGNEYTMDLGADPMANNPPTGDTIRWDSPGEATPIVIVDTTTSFAVLYESSTNAPFTTTDTAGAVILTLVATPEPGTLMLMLIGLGSLGVMAVMCKRKAESHPQST